MRDDYDDARDFTDYSDAEMTRRKQEIEDILECPDPDHPSY